MELNNFNTDEPSSSLKRISPSGSKRTTSSSFFTGIVPAPSFFTLASQEVRMESSRSVAVSVILLPSASHKMLPRIGIVVFRSTTPLRQTQLLLQVKLLHTTSLLLRDGHCFRQTAVAACKRARLKPKLIFESGQFSSILSMVSAGLGVSIVPAMAVEKRPRCC
jgi:DNA-binding transcriptional LysR family regulator